MAKRRKVSNLLALAVLALAAERSMHPYEMATLLRERGKDYSIKINWGSLYTVVTNLERHGLIEATETAREGRRPERTVYAITETGQAELVDWMRELLGAPEKEYHRFEAALSLLGILPPDEVVALLAQRLSALATQISEGEAMLELACKDVPRLFLVEGEYALAMLHAEAEWVRGLIREIEDGSLEGMAVWRAFHDGKVSRADIERRIAERRWDAD
jgi:DNA-binding PadR family transcriptional regulator